MHEEVWIGLATVIPRRPGTFLGDRSVAYVNAVASASDKERFVQRVQRALFELDLDLAEMEDVDVFAARAAEFEVDEQLMAFSRAAQTSSEVFFGTFHTSSSRE